ncbi:EAL domain-containing protein [Pigmentiphaga litoralis]|uniref:EAL domain-containing response regulator n=1 Tax=Pigmentiphaga litoralis TaxID=516702 RepID=UPI003B438147
MWQLDVDTQLETDELASLRVLVVQSQTVHRERIKLELRHAGVGRIDDAANGSQALALLRTRAFDLLIVDLVMPQLDGIQLLDQAAAFCADVRILVVGDADHALLRTARKFAVTHDLCIHDCVPHPLRDGLLAEVLRASLDDMAARRRAPAHTPPAAPGLPCLPASGPLDLATLLSTDCLRVAYQPKMSLSTNRMTGVEALARLHHPEQGILAPDAFMAAVAAQGLMTDLTHRMLGLAAAEQSLWARNGACTPVSVNMPVTVVEAPRAVERLVEVVLRSGSQPEAITLEIIETAPIHDKRAFYRAVAGLRLAGFGLAIDDVGTGHNSLDLLVNGPFTELKVDRSFVARADACAASRAVLEACARLGAELGMTVTAEGVECTAHLAQAALAGCNEVQGHLISTALPAAAIPQWIGRRLW